MTMFNDINEIILHANEFLESITDVVAPVSDNVVLDGTLLFGADMFADAIRVQRTQ